MCSNPMTDPLSMPLSTVTPHLTGRPTIGYMWSSTYFLRWQPSITNIMRPANQQQAEKHMEHLLNRKISGCRRSKVNEHTQRARRIAVMIWTRFQVGPYQYQLKHLIWYLNTWTRHLKPATRYRHWITLRYIVWALNKPDAWAQALQ